MTKKKKAKKGSMREFSLTILGMMVAKKASRKFKRILTLKNLEKKEREGMTVLEK